MTEIKIKDIGPIVEFEYDLTEHGMHVLRGGNGLGKTTTQRMVDLATNGRTDVRPTKRDGSPRGEATIAGKTIRVLKQVRTEGDLTVDGLGDLSIMDLHTPKYDKPETRDRHRIRTLVRLAGVEANAKLFHSLLGGEQAFSEIVPVDALKTDDPVDMAARVKRAIEREALRVEEREQTALADARAQQAIYEATDVNVSTDEAKLQSELENAIKIQQDIRTRRDAATKQNAAAETARKTLAGLGEGLTVAEAEGRFAISCDLATERKQAAEEAKKIVSELEQKLELARADKQRANSALVDAEASVTAAAQMVEQAKREGTLRSELQAAIEAGGAEGPSDEELQVAEAVVADARGGITRGIKAREALSAKARGEQHQASAKKLGEQARRLRDAAGDTATVLTNAIGTIDGCPLRVELNGDGEPVLVMNDAKAEPFDRRSDGQRWVTVMQIAAGDNRLIVLPQEGYSSLAPSARALLHRLAREHRCYILGAMADDGELRAELYSDGKVAAE